MQTLSIEILNPKAIRLLKDLADLKLISIKKEKIISPKRGLTLSEILLNGPVWSDDDLKKHEQIRAEINKIGAE